jgi:cystinosin
MSDFMPIAMPSGHSSDPPDAPALKLRQFAWLATAKRRKVVTISGIVGFVGLSVLMGFTVPGSPKLPSPWNHVSATIGWIYFWAWSISFYPQVAPGERVAVVVVDDTLNACMPQVYSNYARKSVVGLSYDYEAYNILGFVSYTVFNCLFRWSEQVQREYGTTLLAVERFLTVCGVV